MDIKIAQEINDSILNWYDVHHRTLPWRYHAHMKANPYHTWISEVMLQQTTVATVHHYFKKFIAKWPTIQDLALASEQEVLTLWQGLGYYSRARNLLRCARTIIKDYAGQFPPDMKALSGLPGIGDYTAKALLSIAFKQPYVPVDGNVKRIFARLFMLEGSDLALTKQVAEAVEPLRYNQRPGDFAQGLMDLGSLICTSKSPQCIKCPLQKNCYAYSKSRVGYYPVRKTKPQKPTRYGKAFVIVQNNHILLQKRQNTGILANMIEVPSSPWLQAPEPLSMVDSQGPSSLACGPIPQELLKTDLDDSNLMTACGHIKHTFTHFHLILEVYTGANITPFPQHAFWHPVIDLKTLPIPTLMTKVIKCGLGLR